MGAEGQKGPEEGSEIQWGLELGSGQSRETWLRSEEMASGLGLRVREGVRAPGLAPGGKPHTPPGCIPIQSDLKEDAQTQTSSSLHLTWVMGGNQSGVLPHPGLAR